MVKLYLIILVMTKEMLKLYLIILLMTKEMFKFYSIILKCAFICSDNVEVES